VVFKIERDERGKEVFLRLRSGAVRVRGRLSLDGRSAERVTAIRVSTPRGLEQADSTEAGQIAVVRGLDSARIGDSFGPAAARETARFRTPVLETLVEPVDAGRRGVLFAALSELAEQDPLIALHADETTRKIALRFYGEVQKEVVGALLAEEYGVPVTFARTSVVCIERLLGTGASADRIRTGDNPYLATVGLRVAPGPVGSGLRFELDVEAGSMPPAFFAATEEGVRDALSQGLHGWAVPDACVTMTESGYWARQSRVHQKFNKAVSSVAADFRRLAPVVLMAAVRQAGTEVCEPVDRFVLEVPQACVGAVVSTVTRLGGTPLAAEHAAAYARLEGFLPARRLHALSSRLPDLTGGEGALSSGLDHYRPVPGEPPVRARTGPDPLDREVWFREMPR
jgi:ribosomal protection tetracycline resistance protein